MTTNSAAESATPERPRILVVQPDAAGPLDRWDEWLRHDGVAVRLVRPFLDEVIPYQLDASGLVVLGGPMSVHDDADYPWLTDIQALLRRSVEGSVPTLGICLGAQLLAQALGGLVCVGDRGVEAGVATVQLRPDASADALLGRLDDFPMGCLHGDMIERLPPGSRWLASSEAYRHQTFRIGPSAWGVQFHPEISPQTYRTWAGMYASANPADCARVQRGIDEFDAADEYIIRASRSIAERFAELVLASGGPRVRGVRRRTDRGRDGVVRLVPPRPDPL